MMMLGPVGFMAPWLLAALIGLPALWWLLRATPPAPRRVKFPGVSILLGLTPEERTPRRTPWWLLLLRCVIAALIILAFADPVLKPRERLTGEGPLWVVMDAGWGDAPDWEARRAAADDLMAQAERAGRPVVLRLLSDPPTEERAAEPLDAAKRRAELAAAEPRPWAPDRIALLDALSEQEGPAETVWLSDGLDHDGTGAELAQALSAMGPLALYGPAAPLRTIRPGEADADGLNAEILRPDVASPALVPAVARARGEAGAGHAYATAQADFEAGDSVASARFDLPLDLRNKVGLLTLENPSHAGALAFLDARWRRKRVGLVSGERLGADQPLLSGVHYIREALRPLAEIREGGLQDLISSDDLDALILVDVGAFNQSETEALADWLNDGGLLIRFAGPALAAGAADARFGKVEDPFLPVRLRPGGRDLGGAMSWGAPQRLASFDDASPFGGLTIPGDVAISRQVLAEPDADLPERIWARLTDGAPLVTSAPFGEGRIVLFHTSAEPRWSSLPISGLLIDMLRRILDGAAGIGQAAMSAEGETALWRPVLTLDAFGRIAPAPQQARPILGAALLEGAGPDAPPGIYEMQSTGARRAMNLMRPDSELTPLAPEGIAINALQSEPERAFKPWLLAAALSLLTADALATLFLAGRLRRRAAGAAMLLLAVALIAPDARAETSERDLHAALDGALAHVITGDAAVDEMAQAGLFGLSVALTQRTAIEPGEQIGVNLETDDLAIYPLLYWPITDKQPTPSDAAIGKLNAYLRQGGMILFDTRDANLAFGGEGPGTRTLRRVTAGLDLPPLAPTPPTHVLARSFYLLRDFPGRWSGGQVWLEAPPPDSDPLGETPPGFANDGVSPVVVGGHDWAAAWAMNERGDPLAPVDPRQREMAYRFGVNLAMYALTGAYKSDQVHIPMLLERLR